MEKDIKYLNYEVYHSGNLSHQGTVPGILTFSGIEKQFNLGGVWIWHTCPESVCLKLWNEVNTVETYSDRSATSWWNYANEHGIRIPDPHLGRT